MSESSTRFVAPVPEPFQEEGICWLVIERVSKGWFLYYHMDLNSSCKCDTWFQSRGQAEYHALEDWGVARDAWVESP
jgi:hypothetical protein